MQKKISPLSTLESSFDALNLIPSIIRGLHNLMKAAKGLLMNNLGVYGGYRVLFDSSEVPGKCIAPDNRLDKSEQMVLNMRIKDEISPESLVGRFDEDNRRPPDIYTCDQESAEQVDAIAAYKAITMKLILIVMYLIIVGTGIMIMMTEQVLWRRALTVKVQISLVIMRKTNWVLTMSLIWTRDLRKLMGICS